MGYRARLTVKATLWLRDRRTGFWQFWYDVAFEQELHWLRRISQRRIGRDLR